MKKILVVALSALMLLALFIPAMADTAPKFTVAASAEKVKQGEEFTITVSVDQQISSKGFGLQWSAVTGATGAFEFVEGEWNEVIDDEAMLAQVNPSEAVFAASKAFDIPAGVVLTLKVKAKADAKIAVHDLTVGFGNVKVENAIFVNDTIEVYHDCVPATEYTKDDDNHWKICTLGCDKQIGKEAHKYEGTCGETCTVCGHTRTVTHNYTKQNSDANNHWNECSGCGKVDEASKSAHAGGTATCKAKAECSTCGKAYGDFGPHGTLNEVEGIPATCKNPARYKKVCSVCGEQVGEYFSVGSVDPANHTGNNTVTPAVPATCIAEGKTEEVMCNDCGEIVTASTPIPIDPNHHSYDHSCDEACNLCGATRSVTHKYTTRESDGKEHWMKCSVCGKIDENTRKVHSYDSDIDDVCNDCNRKRIIPRDLIVNVSKSEIDRGATVTVSVSLSKPVITTGFGLDYSEIYSKEAFEWVSGAWSESIRKNALLSQANPGTQAVFGSATEFLISGEIFTITLRVKDTATCGEQTIEAPAITIIEGVTRVSTKITVNHVYDDKADRICNGCGYEKPYAPGDVDGNDVVDMDDAIHLLFHVNFPETYLVNQKIDFDGNGKVDKEDAFYLLFHVNFPYAHPLH